MKTDQSIVSRYARQEIFFGIGREGQKKIQNSRVVIMGLSGIGTMTAEYLTRAGVGFIRLVDGDYVERIELQRESLFTEEDAKNKTTRPVAAKTVLQRYNSEVEIDAVISTLNGINIKRYIEDVDLVIDASDSMEDRLLINEACLALKKPWIYGGALAASGMSISFFPGDEQPCLRCLIKDQIYEDGQQPTCATVGVLMPAVGMIASVQAGQALRILSGKSENKSEIVSFDVWQNTYTILPLSRDPDCPVCVHEEYMFYGKPQSAQVQAICGKDSVQIIPQKDRVIDFTAYAEKLSKQGSVSYNKFTLDFSDGSIEIKLFKNGRAIINHVTEAGRAKAIYREYIGL